MWVSWPLEYPKDELQTDVSRRKYSFAVKLLIFSIEYETYVWEEFQVEMILFTRR